MPLFCVEWQSLRRPCCYLKDRLQFNAKAFTFSFSYSAKQIILATDYVIIKIRGRKGTEQYQARIVSLRARAFQKPLFLFQILSSPKQLIYQHEFISFSSDGIKHCSNATQQAVGRQPEVT